MQVLILFIHVCLFILPVNDKCCEVILEIYNVHAASCTCARVTYWV